MRRTHRGTALVTVLLATGVLLVVCMSLATMAVLNLNLAGSYSGKMQSQLIAQAAVNQLVAELDNAQENDPGSGTEMNPAARIDLVARFSRPVFPEGGSRFPADVLITFDRRHPNGHYSVDNSYNEAPAAGWLDRLSAGRSVPPFSIDLIVGVRIGDRTTWYESILRRRWPYALCTPGKITMMGTPTYKYDGRTGTIQPTQINGNVFSLPNTDFCPPPPSPQPGEPPPPDTRNEGAHIFVDLPLIDNLLSVFPRGDALVNVGGTADVRVRTTTAEVGEPIRIVSTGNTLTGSVDFSSAEGNVEEYPGNTAVGSVRRNVRSWNLARNLQRAFELPNLGEFQELEMQDRPPFAPEPPAPPPTPTPEPGPEDGGTPGSPSPPPPSPSPSGGGIGIEPAPEPSPYYVLYEDLVRSGPPRPPDGSSFEYGPEARFLIDMSAGNRYVQPSDLRNVYYTGKGIELHDCVLLIRGDLDLSSTRPEPGQRTIPPALRGTNATIIVDGTLILNNGSLSASDQGMVIYCRRLVSATQGTYKGLIMVQKSAAICPAYPGATIEIQGGMVCGSSPVALYALNPDYDPDSDMSTAQVAVNLQGVHLWSTHLTYDPKYLKTLNRFGPLNVLTLRQIE